MFVDQPPVAVVLHEVADAFGIRRRQFFVGEDAAVGVPAEEGLAAVYHDAVVIRAVAAAGCLRVEVQDRQFAAVRRAAEGAARAAAVVEGVPLLLALLVAAGLQQVNGFDERVFPFVGGRAGWWVVQAINEGALEEFRDVGAAQGVGGFRGVFPRQFARFELRGFDAVARVRRVFNKEGLAAHAQFFVALAVVRIVDFVAPERVAVEQVHVDEDGKRVQVGAAARQFAFRVIFVEVGGFNDFRGDEVRGADYGWRVFAGHNEAVNVDEAGLPRGRVNQAVFVAEVAVREAGHVHAAHGARQHEADFQVAHPVAKFARVKVFVAVVGAREPFAVFFFALDVEHVVVSAAVLEEEVAAVKGDDDAEAVVVFDDSGRPAVEVFQVVAAFLVEDALAVLAGDHFQAFARGRVGFFAEEGDDVVAIRREFDVFHAALGFDFVDEADGLAVGCGEGDDVFGHVVSQAVIDE